MYHSNNNKSMRHNRLTPARAATALAQAARRAIAALAIILLTAATAWAWSGEGTESSPYKISNADDFTKFSNIVNGTNGETRNTSAWGTLTANIDMTGISCSPIGDYDNPYAGTFDGAGHTVEGIRLNGNSRIGLFGVVANGGTVQGITLTNSNISGKNPVGGIAGMNWGTITNCHVTNTVSITGTYLSAAVGGIAGMNGLATGGHNGRVYGCTSAAGIQGTGNSSCVGGIVGNCNASTITDCIAIGAIVNSPYTKGAIVGNMVSSTLSNNYYNGCKVNSSEFTASGVGIGSESTSSQKDAAGRVEPVFCIAAGNDVIMTSSGAATTDYGTNGIKVYSNYLYYNGAFYAKSSASVAMTLGHEEREGYIYSNTYSASDGTFSGSGSAYTLTMPDEDVIVSIARYDLHSFGYTDTYHPDGTTNPYVISDVDGWNLFCDCLNDNDTWNRFSGKTVKLGADIGTADAPVTRMAGGSGHEFTGTFDGGGHKLTVNYANTDNNTRTAPFSYVDGATIQNLIVGGTISGTAYRAAGIIGETGNTTSHITNCVSNVDISSGRYTGGFSIGGNVEIEGCVFNGKIKGTTYSGGFIGYSYSAQVIKNSLFAPQDGSSISGGTFYYNGGGDVAPVNSYYTQALGTAQGKACHSVTAGTDVTIGAIALTGTATQYTVSGITAYSGGGLQLGQTLYYGIDDQLSLTLSKTATGAPLGYRYDGYTASAGTLSGTTLTMPDEDVTISVALAPIDWATVNQGDSKYPYMIYNKDQLLLLAHRVNGTSGETANDYSRKYFKLGADITFSHPDNEGNDYAENYEAIGGNIGGTDRYFRGNFDGDGHTVSGIRIRKTGSDDADNCQGLFGQIHTGANIHDVHLTDARIKGYYYVGGIVGFNFGTVSGCTVTDSHITAVGEYGTVCGWYDGTLTNNYYHGCTVNGTAVTSGVGCQGADITDNFGALPAYAITLGANITTPPGTFAGQTEWLDTPPASARLAPENGFTLAGNHYFASGYVFTPGSTLASGAAQGYTPRATLGGQLLDLYTPTGDNDLLAGKAIARLTITADCDGKTLNAAIRSDGLQHEVSYMTADGTPDEASAIALDGTETTLAAGWYFVGKDISYTATLTLGGDVNLILADGKTMKIRISKKGDGIFADGHSLHFYGQTEGTGALNAQTNDKFGIVIRITNGTLGIHGGNVNANAKSTVSVESAIRVVRATAGDALVIDRGTLIATANSKSSCGIYIDGGDVRINGGQVTATGEQLGINISDYVDEDDESLSIPGILTLSGGTLTASSFDTWSGESYAGTLAVASGLTYTDGTGLYDSTTETATLAALGGKTLQPCFALADAADNTGVISDHAGKTLAVALSGRTLYKDGSWNTLCLPFAVSTASSTLSGDNVQAMTLNTTTSNLTGSTLTLNFTAAETIPAGTPFIIKWDKPSDYVAYDGTNAATCSDLVSPVFMGVTIDTEKHDATVTDVLTFTGTYAPVTITDADGDNTKLYLGAANKLYYPKKAMTIGTHRAYFQLSEGITAGEPASLVRAFVLNFGDDEATGIISVHDSGFMVNGSDAWYTLDGRRLDGQPTAKGLYIHGGRKVIVK